MPGANFLGETFFKDFSNNLWFSKKNSDFWKRFASGWLKLHSSCPEDRFQGKSICLIYFLSILSGHRAEKTSFFGENFSIKLLKCILRVQRKTLRKANFPRKTISFYHFWNSKKIVRNFVTKIQKRNCVHLFRRVGWNVINDFYEEIMFLFITLELNRRNFEIQKKISRQRFQKCIRRFLRNVFRISVVFLKETLKFHQSLTLKRNCFRTSCQIYDKVVITEIYLSSWTL